jgi:hypothetical protein
MLPFMGSKQVAVPALSVRQKIAEVALGLDDRTIVRIYRSSSVRLSSYERVLRATIELGLAPPPPPNVALPTDGRAKP